MIFQATWQQVIDGSKTQTRRLVKSSDELRDLDAVKFVYHINDGWCGNEGPNPEYPGRTKWQVGNTYAVQPGRGKKAIARILITGIRKERLQDISPEDVMSEGVFCNQCGNTGSYVWSNVHSYDGVGVSDCDCKYAFAELWQTIHTTPGDTWQDNPTVWVLEFKLVEAMNDD